MGEAINLTLMRASSCVATLSFSTMQAQVNFERGLTPKLVREGMRSRSNLAASNRSRSVMGTSDSGWHRQ